MQYTFLLFGGFGTWSTPFWFVGFPLFLLMAFRHPLVSVGLPLFQSRPQRASVAFGFQLATGKAGLRQGGYPHFVFGELC